MLDSIKKALDERLMKLQGDHRELRVAHRKATEQLQEATRKERRVAKDIRQKEIEAEQIRAFMEADSE